MDLRISVAAIKRGTSIGLWWGIISGGYQYFEKPIKRALQNEMIYDSGVPNSPDALDPNFMDSLQYWTVRGDIIQDVRDVFYYFELDVYNWSNWYTAADTGTTLNIPLRRISFGIQFTATNFTGGRLIADYGNKMKTDYFTPADMNNTLSIYTADVLRWADAIEGFYAVPLTLKWEKTDGTTVVLGSTSLAPKRNSLTTVNVTLPLANSTAVGINLTDTTFTGNNDVDF